MGRPHIKGERIWQGMFDSAEVHHSTIRCIVDTVNSDDGYVTLDFDGLPSVGRPATVPWLWASFPSVGEGAWGRYMPFPQDVLKVSFDFDSTPQVVGYDVKAASPETADGKTGWPQLKRAAAAGVFPLFRPLESGEFDFMSVGGAYIFGSATGQLTLSAGAANIVLTRSTESIATEAAQYKLQSGASRLRYGQVRRALPGFPGEIAGYPTLPNPKAIWNPDGSLAEFQVQVNRTVAGVGLPMGRVAIGAVTSDTGIPELASSGGPRRFALEIWDDLGATKVSTVETDSLGSTTISAPLAQTFQVKAPLAQASIVAAGVDLGLVPTGGVMEGNAFGTIMNPAIIALQASLATAVTPTQVAAAVSQFAGALSSAIAIATSKSVKVQV